MGEVAVMHSEPLQFECNDMNHITEKDVCNQQSNEEDREINDLRDRGYMEHG